MSEQIKDGGPAFPITSPVDETGHCAVGYPYPESGMTLRDYFAAKVLQGMVTTITTQEIRDLADGLKGGMLNAKAAYVLADAMLAAREAKS